MVGKLLILAAASVSLVSASEVGPAWTNNNENRQPVESIAAVDGFTGSSEPCVSEFGYKTGSKTTQVTSCVDISAYAPYNYAQAPGASGHTKWCFTGPANPSGSFVYNLDKTDKREQYAFCTEEVNYTTTAGFVDEDTACAWHWNYNNGSGPIGVMDSCVTYSQYPPQSDGATLPTGYQNMKWCYTGPDTGYNPEQKDGGVPTAKTKLWGFCKGTEPGSTANPTTAPTAGSTSQPTTSPSVTGQTPNPTSTQNPTTSPTVSGTEQPTPAQSTTPTSSPTQSSSPTTSPTPGSDASAFGYSLFVTVVAFLLM